MKSAKDGQDVQLLPASLRFLVTRLIRASITIAVWQCGESKRPARRAAAAFAGRLYVLGGFDEKGKVVLGVSIYDPQSGVWTKGPDLSGDGIDGFAPAACVHSGRLYVSVADGALYRLDNAGLAWEKAGTATPRVAHRLASDGKTILIIGGARDGKNTDLIESVAAD